jgi:hypothetical protein
MPVEGKDEREESRLFCVTAGANAVDATAGLCREFGGVDEKTHFATRPISLATQLSVLD